MKNQEAQSLNWLLTSHCFHLISFITQYICITIMNQEWLLGQCIITAMLYYGNTLESKEVHGWIIIMTNDRYRALERNTALMLTQAEIDEGWHFCIDWDGMLIGPGMTAVEGCQCQKPISLPPSTRVWIVPTGNPDRPTLWGGPARIRRAICIY